MLEGAQTGRGSGELGVGTEPSTGAAEEAGFEPGFKRWARFQISETGKKKVTSQVSVLSKGEGESGKSTDAMWPEDRGHGGQV